MENKSHGKSVGGALLLGLAAGAIIGVLAAPKKGSQTQKDLAKLAKKLVDELKDLKPEEYEKAALKLIEKYQKQFNLGKDTVLHLKDQLMNYFKQK